ncbi:MAG: HAD family hydrolase [Xanthobacteraceae bacterium]|jgi:FMN phosphatase YigB (HAD superfamily)
MNAPIETLLFDFGGTLDANGVAWKERFHAYYRAEGLDLPAAAFQPNFFAADSSLVGRLPHHTDLAGTVHALVCNLDFELASSAVKTVKSRPVNGCSPRGARVAARFLSDASAAFVRNRPVLEELRKRYQLGIVSNFYGNLEAVCHGANLASLFSVMVDSQRVGAEKPDPAIFHAALNALRASPETTVLVGDSLRRDGEGARRTGMRFIWMMPQVNPDASAQPPLEQGVTELSELLRILQ